MKKATVDAFRVEQLEVRLEMQVLAAPIDVDSCGACASASCAAQPLFN